MFVGRLRKRFWALLFGGRWSSLEGFWGSDVEAWRGGEISRLLGPLVIRAPFRIVLPSDRGRLRRKVLGMNYLTSKHVYAGFWLSIYWTCMGMKKTGGLGCSKGIVLDIQEMVHCLFS